MRKALYRTPSLTLINQFYSETVILILTGPTIYRHEQKRTEKDKQRTKKNRKHPKRAYIHLVSWLHTHEILILLIMPRNK